MCLYIGSYMYLQSTVYSGCTVGQIGRSLLDATPLQASFKGKIIGERLRRTTRQILLLNLPEAFIALLSIIAYH